MDHQTVVAQSQAAIEATIAFGLKQMQAPMWEPKLGSEAAAELAPAEIRANGSPWGDRPAQTAYAAASLMMTGVLDNLDSLQQLVGNQTPVIGPTLVTRSTVEITSGIFWLMEPRIGARTRVCRELVLSLTSARRAKHLAGEYRATGWPSQQRDHRGRAAGGHGPAADRRPGDRPAERRLLAHDRAPDRPGRHTRHRGDAPAAHAVQHPGHRDLPDVLSRDARRGLRPDELHGPGVTTTGTPILYWYLPRTYWTAQSR